MAKNIIITAKFTFNIFIFLIGFQIKNISNIIKNFIKKIILGIFLIIYIPGININIYLIKIKNTNKYKNNISRFFKA